MTAEQHNAEPEHYQAARNRAAWLLQAGTGVLRVKGADRLNLLQRLTTNSMHNLVPGRGRQTVLLSEKARIIDVLTVLLREEDLILLCSPGNQDTVRRWFMKYTIMDDFKTADQTADFRCVQVLGPHAAGILSELSGQALDDMAVSDWKQVELFGVSATLVRLPTMCEFSFLLLLPAAQAAALEAGFASFGEAMPQISPECYEVLRVEAGLGKTGTEWTEAYNPLEANMIGLVDFKKGCYIGQEVIARLDTYNKVKQHLIGFSSALPIPPGAEFRDATRSIGQITSTVYSPELQKHIALGYIRGQYANPGAEVTAHLEEASFRLRIEKLPFTM